MCSCSAASGAAAELECCDDDLLLFHRTNMPRTPRSVPTPQATPIPAAALLLRPERPPELAADTVVWPEAATAVAALDADAVAERDVDVLDMSDCWNRITMASAPTAPPTTILDGSAVVPLPSTWVIGARVAVASTLLKQPRVDCQGKWLSIGP